MNAISSSPPGGNAMGSYSRPAWLDASCEEAETSLYVRYPSGRAVAQRLDAGFPPRRPGFAYGQHVGFVVDKATLR
jgi:hypothetical protein